MKTAAVICEFNPFHKGHTEALRQIRALGFNSAVAVMSGDFVQRGGPAVYDKYTRAEAAVRCGFDLVIELPFPFSCACAEKFAECGVAISSRLGFADGLVFGSECGDIGLLESYTDNIESSAFKEECGKLRNDKRFSSLPPAKLRQTSYERLFGGFYPTESNDILGSEYVRAIKKLSPWLNAYTYKRKEGFSATSARTETGNGVFKSIPSPAKTVFQNSERYSPENGERVILSFLRESDARELSLYEEMTADLASRLIRSAKKAASLEEFEKLAASPAYSNARIRRAVTLAMCSVKKGLRAGDINSALVLGIGKNGKELLGKAKREGGLALVTKPASLKKNTDAPGLYTLRADALYTIFGNNIREEGYFLKKTPFVL